MDLPSKQISKGQGIASQVEFEPDAKVVQTHFGGQTSLKAGDDILFGIREKPSKASPSSVSGGNDNMYQDPEEFIQTSRGFHATSTTPNWYIPLPPPPPPPPKSRILWLILVVCLVAFLGGSAMTYTFLKDKNFTGHVFGLQQPTPLPTPFQPSQTLSPQPSPQSACTQTATQSVAIFSLAAFSERKLWPHVPTNTVNIFDQANVLDQNCLFTQASMLPYPIDIYTTNTFQGTKAAFRQQTASHTLGNSDLIVMAIDTVHHFVDVSSGSKVPLSNSQATDAAKAFASNFKNGGYTGASIAAIRSLQQSLGQS